MAGGTRIGSSSLGGSWGLAVVLAIVAATWAGGSAPAADAKTTAKPTRYSLAGGCYALRAQSGDFVARDGAGYAATARGVGGAEPFRMQATDLGRYLLYGSARDFLALDGQGVVAAPEPSDDADWTVRERGSGFVIANEFAGERLAVTGDGALAAGAPETFRFVKAKGCPRYPEVAVNVKGKPGGGSPRFGEVTGTVEGHMHGMAFEFLGGRAHCGRPWHRFGAPYALRDCVDHEASGGCGAVLDNALYGEPARCHEPTGWPSFEGWPDHRSLTHEQSYWRWLERAWAGGLRLYVNLMVENRALCELYPLKQNSCNEMESVLLQIERIHEFEDYIDAQSGGPGKGFFRIVETPFEARKAINDGKLAVVLGMEVSEPFGCQIYLGSPMCDEAQIDSWIDRLHDLGVRQLEITNKFDNALTGVAGDNGTTGTIVNGGNFYTTGRFWDLEHCDEPENHDNEPTGVAVHNDDELIANGLDAFAPPGAVPVYGEPPYCNTMGLTALGEHAIRELIDREMIFDPDHMSVLGRNQALTLVESREYSGIVSSHSWSTPNALPRIYKLGGVVTPSSSEADRFIHEWQHLRDAYTGRQYFGVGYGADMNGFAGQPGPRDPALGDPVSYPFRSLDGSTKVRQQRSGSRTYDINADGVAHYGLYPDWYQDLREVGGRKISRDMRRGAEAYLQMWERATGIGEVRCDRWRQRFLTERGFKDRLELGDRPRRVLRRSGQPVDRTRAWRWCAHTKKRGGTQKKGGKQRVVAVFTNRGRVALILSTLHKQRADGLRPGMKASELEGKAQRFGGVFVRGAGAGRKFVYGVRGGRISFVALAARGASSSPATLRRYLRHAR
jgi:microsomal dipeptidase-like Zn-dependent dipeptidase